MSEWICHENSPPVLAEITFQDSPNQWFLKITKKGFIFNRERFPEASIDEFAKAFMELLEKEFDVHFTQKKPYRTDNSGDKAERMNGATST